MYAGCIIDINNTRWCIIAAVSTMCAIQRYNGLPASELARSYNLRIYPESGTRKSARGSNSFATRSFEKRNGRERKGSEILKSREKLQREDTFLPSSSCPPSPRGLISNEDKRYRRGHDLTHGLPSSISNHEIAQLQPGFSRPRRLFLRRKLPKLSSYLLKRKDRGQIKKRDCDHRGWLSSDADNTNEGKDGTNRVRRRINPTEYGRRAKSTRT